MGGEDTVVEKTEEKVFVQDVWLSDNFWEIIAEKVDGEVKSLPVEIKPVTDVDVIDLGRQIEEVGVGREVSLPVLKQDAVVTKDVLVSHDAIVVQNDAVLISGADTETIKLAECITTLGNILEVRKADNSGLQSSERERNMSVEEKALYQAIELKIDNSAKLESATSLIFEKAISEPRYSVAYAYMCRVLTNNLSGVPTSNEPNARVIRFREVLLNKCQTEFEKEGSDKKKLKEDRSKTYDTEEEKNAHLDELDYREMMNRRRKMGNIRFIGELYKLKMISEPTMHDCINKLLQTKKLEHFEDKFECLCILLTTVGKMIDHQKAKPRVDQYFERINKIIKKYKISSRIQLALKDVIDLRGRNWVS